jgi:hypothetical protein
MKVGWIIGAKHWNFGNDMLRERGIGDGNLTANGLVRIPTVAWIKASQINLHLKNSVMVHIPSSQEDTGPKATEFEKLLATRNRIEILLAWDRDDGSMCKSASNTRIRSLPPANKRDFFCLGLITFGGDEGG